MQSSYKPPAGLYSPSPLPSRYGYSSPSPSPSPYSPTPYSPRPTPYAYTAPPKPVASPTPPPLFGISPLPSPRPGGYPGAYSSPSASPYGYGATPYGPQPSPAAAPSPYYGISTPGNVLQCTHVCSACPRFVDRHLSCECMLYCYHALATMMIDMHAPMSQPMYETMYSSCPEEQSVTTSRFCCCASLEY